MVRNIVQLYFSRQLKTGWKKFVTPILTNLWELASDNYQAGDLSELFTTLSTISPRAGNYLLLSQNKSINFDVCYSSWRVSESWDECMLGVEISSIKTENGLGQILLNALRRHCHLTWIVNVVPCRSGLPNICHTRKKEKKTTNKTPETWFLLL